MYIAHCILLWLQLSIVLKKGKDKPVHYAILSEASFVGNRYKGGQIALGNNCDFNYNFY